MGKETHAKHFPGEGVPQLVQARTTSARRATTMLTSGPGAGPWFPPKDRAESKWTTVDQWRCRSSGGSPESVKVPFEVLVDRAHACHSLHAMVISLDLVPLDPTHLARGSLGMEAAASRVSLGCRQEEKNKSRKQKIRPGRSRPVSQVKWEETAGVWSVEWSCHEDPDKVN